MKLMYCIDCKVMISINIFERICDCGHCACKKLPNSTKVIVYGPCKVYAVKDSTLTLGRGELWKIKKDHPDVEYVTELKKLSSA